MKDIIRSGNIIKRIRDGNDLREIADYARTHIFQNGPKDIVILEILSYLKLFQPDFFHQFENEIIETMGLFFKEPAPDSLQSAVFDMYHQFIKEKYGEDYTPVQVNILNQIKENQYFSFSAPTSTGKSFVFRNLIRSSAKDVAVIVPSRALINEYYDRIRELVDIRTVNVLTFVDRINTKYAKRSIFILTPERARELFKNKHWLQLELMLFDEAQLSDEKSVRGLYFDSIVRRALKTFPDAKYVFAHPFIENPDAQLKKNNIVDASSTAINYTQKNVGQIFYVHDTKKDEFYHLGTNKELLGKQKLKATFDPIERTILNGGSVLIYVPKSHIYDKQVFTQFAKYLKLCAPVKDPVALKMIDDLREYIGAANGKEPFYYSEMLEKLSYGIVTHHGSMPLTARLILEHFTQQGFCRICFATSTLEQGINMPFDIVYLDRFEARKPLSVKNLIGRAGRSTKEKKFDYGSVIIHENAITSFRKTINRQKPLTEVSRLDISEESLDEKYNEFKDAINNSEFSDEYNMTNQDLIKVTTDDVTAMIPALLDMLIDDDGQLISPDSDMKKDINDIFEHLYEQYLGRKLIIAEKAILDQAIKIMIWRVHGRTFHHICQYRFAYTARVKERKKLYDEGRSKEADSLKAKYLAGFRDIPNKALIAYPLISATIPAKDVDYDRIVYDTYDYLDKLIGFKLSDIFYAMFYKYYEKTQNDKALKVAKYIKYGTAHEREIWMLRYGLSFEDIEWASTCINKIDEREILFNEKIQDLDSAQLNILKPFLH